MPTAFRADDHRSVELRANSTSVAGPAVSPTLVAMTATTAMAPSGPNASDALEEEQLEDLLIEEQLEEDSLAELGTTGVEALASVDPVEQSTSVAEIGDAAGVSNDAAETVVVADEAHAVGSAPAP